MSQKKEIVFITGNPAKAKQFSEWVGMEIRHQKVDLDELQSTDLEQVVRHKVQQAYSIVGAPVIVEDVALVFSAISPLPGPLIRWFNDLGMERLCRLLDGFEDRSASGRILYAYYDGQSLELFEGVMNGQITMQPKGSGGFGFDQIFVNDGQDKTRAELDEETYRATSYRAQAIAKLRDYLLAL